MGRAGRPSPARPTSDQPGGGGGRYTARQASPARRLPAPTTFDAQRYGATRHSKKRRVMPMSDYPHTVFQPTSAGGVC